jgi:transposase
MSDQEKQGKYELLEALVQERGLALKGAYTNRDVANIFGVSVRTIQDWSRSGDFKPRNLPGRARFLSADLEEFLQDSSKSHNTMTDDSQNLRYIARNRSQLRRADK